MVTTRFFDWTDICIAHPFFEMATIIETVFDKSALQPEVDVRTRLRNAYLQPWTEYEPMERLIEAFETIDLARRTTSGHELYVDSDEYL